MHQELLTVTIQDLETILAKGNCSCHFINPNKTRIILWKEVKADQVIYHLRIGIQKFISFPLTDKNHDTYWRFKVGEREIEIKENVTTNPDPDAITKFYHRQAKTQALNNHGESDNSESATVNQQSN